MTDKDREATLKELAIIEDIAANWNPAYGGAHYSTRSDYIEKSGLPYELVQTWKDDLGNTIWHGYRYYWKSRWDKGVLYLQETKAGKLHRSMDAALQSLKEVLLDYLKNG